MEVCLRNTNVSPIEKAVHTLLNRIDLLFHYWNTFEYYFDVFILEEYPWVIMKKIKKRVNRGKSYL